MYKVDVGSEGAFVDWELFFALAICFCCVRYVRLLGAGCAFVACVMCVYWVWDVLLLRVGWGLIESLACFYCVRDVL